MARLEIDPSAFEMATPAPRFHAQDGDDGECGICHESLVEQARGVIDSCVHAFCYACILKWSSIESRCPFCRSRFGVIRRVGTDGALIAEEVVPARDQRAIFENRDFIDWLESVRCVVCNGSEDEDRLMLCDGCDQACHTFCVGLTAVPEDAWFCQQCEAARSGDPGLGDALMDETLVDTDSPIGRTRRRAIRSTRSTRSTRAARPMRIDTDSETGDEGDGDGDSAGSDIEEIPETSAPPRRRPRMLLLDTDSDEGVVWDDRRPESGREASVVDLTSPVGGVSPQILDLRSRLRAQLLSSGAGLTLPGSAGDPESIDMAMNDGDPGAHVNPRQAAPRSPVPRTLGFATTVSDLTFGTNVAAGRRTATPTPRDATRGHSGRFSGQTFAERAQALLRERLSDFGGPSGSGCGIGSGRTPGHTTARTTTTTTATTTATKGGAPPVEVIDLRDSREGGLNSNGPGVQDADVGVNERARALRRVKARMNEKLAGISLPPSMVAAVQEAAVSLLVADAARWSFGAGDGRADVSLQLVDDAIDEALTTFNTRSGL